MTVNRQCKPVRLVGGIFIIDPLFGSTKKLTQCLLQACQSEEELSELSALPVKVPSDAPAHFPRVILTEPSQAWQLICSLEKINLKYYPENVEEENEKIQPNRFWEICLNLFGYLQGTNDLEINRMAGVTQTRLDIEENATERVNQFFFRDDIPELFKKNQHSTQWHVNNRVSLESSNQEFTLNRVTRVKAPRISTEPENDKLILIETDINTIPDSVDIRFQREEIKTFFGQLEILNSQIMEALDDANLFT